MDQLLLDALRALADPARLRIAGLLAERPRHAEALAVDAGLPIAALTRHLALLAAAGVAEQDGAGAWSLRQAAFIEIGRRLGALEGGAASQPGTDPDGRPLAAEDAKVLAAFVVDGRLVSIPAQERKRSVILRWLREHCFAEDRVYPEKEVNMRLALVHPDVAALRRYLVDHRLMTRASGEYRRAERAEPAE